MSTKPPPPTSWCNEIMYNLGNYTYQCMTVEEYRQLRYEHRYDKFIVVGVLMFLIFLIIIVINKALK